MNGNKHHNKSGQILLITIMLVATALTIALSITFTATTETQVTKLEEENQKTLAAAEAGIESLIDSGNSSISIGGSQLGNDYQNYTGTASVDDDQDPTFTTPLINKDEQYTFYLTNYDPVTKTLFNPPSYTGNITIDVSPSTPITCDTQSEFAIELTFANINGTIERKVIDTCHVVGGTGSLPTTYLSGSYPSSHLLILRIITPNSSFSGAKLKITSSTGADLPLQGKKYTSEAQSTQSRTTKKIELIQSYPQIPADFFVTSF